MVPGEFIMRSLLLLEAKGCKKLGYHPKLDTLHIPTGVVLPWKSHKVNPHGSLRPKYRTPVDELHYERNGNPKDLIDFNKKSASAIIVCTFFYINKEMDIRRFFKTVKVDHHRMNAEDAPPNKIPNNSPDDNPLLGTSKAPEPACFDNDLGLIITKWIIPDIQSNAFKPSAQYDF